jgi:hypothetical protein
MLATFITVPTTLVADISAGAGGIFTDLLPVAVVVIGVSLGLLLLNWAISQFRTRTKRGM